MIRHHGAGLLIFNPVVLDLLADMQASLAILTSLNKNNDLIQSIGKSQYLDLEFRSSNKTVCGAETLGILVFYEHVSTRDLITRSAFQRDNPLAFEVAE